MSGTDGTTKSMFQRSSSAQVSWKVLGMLVMDRRIGATWPSTKYQAQMRSTAGNLLRNGVGDSSLRTSLGLVVSTTRGRDRNQH